MSSGISGVGGGTPPQVPSGASSMSAQSNKLAQLFKQVDTGNSGSISKPEFEAVFSKAKLPQKLKDAGADAVYSKLDPNNTGIVSKQDFMNTMRNIMAQGRTERQHQKDSQAIDPGVTSAASTVAANIQELHSTFSATL